MPEWLTYELAKDFQSSIVGLLGFTGVIITLVVNAGIARSNLKKTVTHNKNVVRIALVGELLEFKENINYLQQCINNSHDHLVIPPQEGNDIYKVMLKDIGLLEPKQVEQVIKAYAGIQHFRLTLEILSERRGPIIYLPRKNYIIISGSMEALEEQLRKAIAALVKPLPTMFRLGYSLQRSVFYYRNRGDIKVKTTAKRAVREVVERPDGS